MPISNKFLTHEGKLYQLEDRVGNILWSQGIIADSHFLRILVAKYITPTMRRELHYVGHAPAIVKLYKDSFAWENGMVEYILKTKKAMDNETANHLR